MSSQLPNKMSFTKRMKVFLLCCMALLSLLYFIAVVKVDNNTLLTKDTFLMLDVSSTELIDSYSQIIEEENQNYLINTPGCSIPNYSNTLKIIEAKYSKSSTCGTRTVFIKKISDEEIAFRIDAKMEINTKGKNFSCCYQFGSAAIVEGKEDYTKLRYSSCIDFKNNTKGALKHEVITVTCKLKANTKIIYEDAYLILKKLNTSVAEDEQKAKQPWNVLVLGMDTVSRARAYSSMPKTAKYMLQNGWLDYRAYHKVGYNTFPNLISVLTGRKLSTIYRNCSSGLDRCNHLFTWSEYKKAGYVTATGEDNLSLPDTFAKLGYKSPPTDHYVRPFFLTGETHHGNIICTKKKPSAKHLLDYASMFTETYKDKNFFGFFWLNSYSHNLEHLPTLIEKDLVSFFSKLNETGVLRNTFIYFLSDHGLRSGQMRVPYESYYEERLPMLFIWVPTEFRNSRAEEYKNMNTNQHKLITPYDLYLTLYSTITNNSTELNSEACPKCKSIFNSFNNNRTCEEAGVPEEWCSCHEMTNIDHKDDDVVNATNIAVGYVQNKVSAAKTTHCTKCEMLKLKKILRSHTYRDEHRNNTTYYVIAFVMTPGDVAYEVVLAKRNEQLTLLNTNTISVYNVRGRCAIAQNDRAYCVCANTCTKKNIN